MQQQTESESETAPPWKSINEAILEVRRDAMARTPSDDDWFDPADSKWWSECRQIGDLDPNECAEQYSMRSME